MGTRIAGGGLSRALLFALASSLLILASEQFVSYWITGSVLGPRIAATYFLPPLFALSLASYAVASLLGFWTIPIRRRAIIMVVLVVYLASIVLLWLMAAGGRPLLAVLAVVAGFWGVVGVRNRPLRPVVSIASAIVHLGAAIAWLTINPEKILGIYPVIAFSAHGIVVGLLLAGCFELVIASGNSRIPHYTIGLALCVLVWLSVVAEPLRWTSVSSPRPEASNRAPLPNDFPNLLWIVLDTLRKDHLPFHRYGRNTAPFLSELVLESTVYHNAVSTAGWTLPSHASMFTGLYVREHGAHRSGNSYSGLDEEKITVAEILQGAGYRTAAFSANNGFVQPKTGLAQGFDSFSNFEMLPHRLVRIDLVQFWIDLIGGAGSEALRVPYPIASEVTSVALEWTENQGESPWFLFLNYMEAHRPRRPPAFHRDLYPGRISAAFRLPDRRGTPRGDAFTPEELDDLNSQYDAQIRTLDLQLMILFQTLSQRNQLENTLTVITSDHGDHLGEHDLISHGVGLYKELLDVPLIIRRPGGKGAGVERRPMSTVEIPAIVLAEIPLDRLELGPDHRAHMERLDRRHQDWENGFIVSELYLNDTNPGALHSGGIAIQQDGFKFIASHSGEVLFDLERDPRELVDVRHRHRQMTNEMQSSIERYKRTVPEHLGAAAVLDSSEDIEALRALGYIE
ncbi:MAG: sulfatase-like hydrolase/transferase [Myxococcota bacterium]